VGRGAARPRHRRAAVSATRPGDPDLAQARLHAWHRARPSPADWHRLESAQGLVAFLEVARQQPFGPWLADLDEPRSLHAIDAALAAAFGSIARRFASWFPPSVRAPIEQLATLPTLAVRRHLQRGGEIETWMVGAARGAAAGGPTPDGLDAFVSDWLSRWPGGPDSAIATVARELAAATRALRDTLRVPAGRERELRRASMRTRVELLFRRSAGTPVAACVELCELALAMLRLRSGLARRVLEERAVSVAT
jgi:hypothetical protein